MSKVFDNIENKLKILIDDLQKIFNNEIIIKTIEILIPTAFNDHSKIKRLTLSDSLENYKYITDNLFSEMKNKIPQRSLFYLMFKESFRYKKYRSTEKESKKVTYEFYPDEVEINEQLREKLSNKNKKNLEDFWLFWHEKLRQKKYGNSTLWTYILLESDDNNNKNSFISAAFLVLSDETVDEKQKINFEHANKKIQDLLIKTSLDLHKESIIQNATRAAISQVMLRNMSHNIGSHVLSNMLDVTAIESFIKKSSSEIIEQYTGFKSNNIFAKEPKNLIANFNSYMRNRMDFLADATTGVPTIESSKWLFKEIISGIDKNRLLLNRISGINDFYFKFKVNNYVNEKKNENNGDYSVREISNKKEGDEEKFKIENDILVSIPNDVLGFHAIYVIIENIIRNSAKHSADCDKGKNKDNPIIINIDIKETTELKGTNANELYEINIYEDCIIKNKKKPIDNEDKKKYSIYFKPEKNGDINIGYLNKLVFDMNYRLNQSVLDKGVLRQGSWGLIEMDASAAYLRKIPIEKIDEDHFEIDMKNGVSFLPEKECEEKHLNILKAIKIDEKHFGYRFFVYKPREVLIIYDNNSLSNIVEGKRKKLLQEGILVCDINGETNNLFTFDKSKIYNHKLVVVISNNPDDIINSNRTGISERILKIGLNESTNHSALDLIVHDSDNFKKEIWKCYLRNTKYEFFKDYSGLLNLKSAGVPNIQNGDIAYYLDHGAGYHEFNSKFKEIRYSAVENFMPVNKDVVTTIQFLDSIHTKVVIVDERIQAYSKSGKYYSNDREEISVKCIYKNTNIIIPDESSADLNKSNFDDQYDNILKIFEDNCKAFFYVIHLGIIEKLIVSNNRKVNAKQYNKDKQIKEFIKDFICAEYNIEYNKIIIISGRGTPHNLPENTRYLNYSIISQYMIDIRFKYLLSEALFSSRKIK